MTLSWLCDVKWRNFQIKSNRTIFLSPWTYLRVHILIILIYKIYLWGKKQVSLLLLVFWLLHLHCLKHIFKKKNAMMVYRDPICDIIFSFMVYCQKTTKWLSDLVDKSFHVTASLLIFFKSNDNKTTCQATYVKAFFFLSQF